MTKRQKFHSIVFSTKKENTYSVLDFLSQCVEKIRHGSRKKFREGCITHTPQGLINRWAKWAIAQGGKLLGAANFHSTCRNK